jgi:hypothetical protein
MRDGYFWFELRDALLTWFPPYRRWRERQIAEAMAEGYRRAMESAAPVWASIRRFEEMVGRDERLRGRDGEP